MNSCKFCGKEFAHAKHKVRHERTVHGTDDLIKCIYCDLSFRNDTMERHTRSVHGVACKDTTTKYERCVQCGDEINKTKLHKHAQTHIRKRRHESISTAQCGKRVLGTWS